MTHQVSPGGTANWRFLKCLHIVDVPDCVCAEVLQVPGVLPLTHQERLQVMITNNDNDDHDDIPQPNQLNFYIDRIFQ